MRVSPKKARRTRQIKRRSEPARSIGPNGITVEQMGKDVAAGVAKLAFGSTTRTSEDTPASTADTDENFKKNAEAGWNYYKGNGRVSDAIQYHMALALGEDTNITCPDEDMEDLANEYARKHNIHDWVYEQIEQLLAKGENASYRHVDKNELIRLQTVNPSSLELIYKDGELTEFKQDKESFTDLDNFLHQKWGTPSYAKRGLTMVYTAFGDLEDLATLKRTDKKLMEDYRQPLKHVMIGGLRGKNYYKADQRSIDAVVTQIEELDHGDFLATNDLVEIKTHFPDEKVPDNSQKYERADKAISLAMQMPLPLASGDSTNYSTADAAVDKERVQVGRIRKKARQLWAFAMEPFILANDIEEELKYGKVDNDPSVDIDVVTAYLEAFKLGIISQGTMLSVMKLDSETENERLSDEGKKYTVEQVLSLVSSGVIESDEAREMLGLGASDKTEEAEEQPEEDNNDGESLSSVDLKDVVTLYASAGIPMLYDEGKSCDIGHNHNHKHPHHKKLLFGQGNDENNIVTDELEELVSVYEPDINDYEDALRGASVKISKELKKLQEIASKTEGHLERIKMLEGLKDRLNEIQDELTETLESVCHKAIEQDVKAGVTAAVNDLQNKAMIEAGTKPTTTEALILAMFNNIDDAALEYLKTGQFRLMGSVASELMGGIYKEIVSGVATGESLDKVVKAIGKFVDDPEEFKTAGKTTFRSAQTRLHLIVRTETMRAYNEGCKQTYKEMGVKKVRWIMTKGCPLCEAYHNQEFDISDLPPLPLHPRCKCTIVAVVEIEDTVEEDK